MIDIGRIRELTEKLDEIAKKYPDMITKQDKELEKQWLEELERIESNGRDSLKTVQVRRRTRAERIEELEERALNIAYHHSIPLHCIQQPHLNVD